MAKELSEKSKVIREAIGANPDLGNTDLAALINSADARKKDKITVTATDVNNQKQALKAMAETAAKSSAAPEPAAAAPEPAPPAKPQLTRNGVPRKKPGRKPGYKKPVAAPVAAAAKPAKAVSPLDVIEGVFGLAEQVGGMGQLKRLVDRLATR